MIKTLFLVAVASRLILGQPAVQPKPVIRNNEARAAVDQGRIGSLTRKNPPPVMPPIEAPPAEEPRSTGTATDRPPRQPVAASVEEVLKIGTDLQVRTTGGGAPAQDHPELLHRWNAEASRVLPEAGPGRNDPRATLSSPSNGATLSTTQRFSWNAAPAAARYWLTVGSCHDCGDIFDVNLDQSLSVSVNLPADGRAIYATLYTQFGGVWFWNDYQFRAPTSGSATPAVLLSPSNGSTLSASQTFSWDTGSGVALRWLNIGSCELCGDIIDTNITDRSSMTVALPRDGRVIHVTIWSLSDGNWYTRLYSFRAPTGSTSTPPPSNQQQIRVNIANKLRYAVSLTVNGTGYGTIPAGETRYADAVVSGDMTVSWDLVRPTLSGRELGDVMGGRFSPISNPSGPYTFTVDNVVGSSMFFRPLVTNSTATNLLMEVNGGLLSQNRCDCVVGANRTDVQFGYYLLYQNSNVRAYRDGGGYQGSYIFWGTDSNGRISPSGEIGNSAAVSTGEVRLRATSAP